MGAQGLKRPRGWIGRQMMWIGVEGESCLAQGGGFNGKSTLRTPKKKKNVSLVTAARGKKKTYPLLKRANGMSGWESIDYTAPTEGLVSRSEGGIGQRARNSRRCGQWPSREMLAQSTKKKTGEKKEGAAM